ncbi:hypothetical protein RB653_006012 [Dictyostelium firmibasis]|uniref:Uncharacterized protein n=1 Tax=Dictyostelium firmibasis TaxID=79012 RepID=A0AAN7YYQ0_9MYCE
MNLNNKNEIDYQIKDLILQLEEVKKTKNSIYQKKSNIYFLQPSKDQIISSLKDDISKKNKELEGFEEITNKNNTTKTTTSKNKELEGLKEITNKNNTTTTTTTKNNATTKNLNNNSKFKPNVPNKQKK